MRLPPGNETFVFINCPFDKAYAQLFHSILFTIYRCGFEPRCALEEDNGCDYRLEKIMRCIAGCRLGIHDISRTEVPRGSLPRFNMPFELGIFFGASRFGGKIHRQKKALIFERYRYSYQKSLSDLNGIDTKAHENDPKAVIRQVRDWLVTVSGRSNLPGHLKLWRDYQKFRKFLPVSARAIGMKPTLIPYTELCRMMKDATNKLSTAYAP